MEYSTSAFHSVAAGRIALSVLHGGLQCSARQCLTSHGWRRVAYSNMTPRKDVQSQALPSTSRKTALARNRPWASSTHSFAPVSSPRRNAGTSADVLCNLPKLASITSNTDADTLEILPELVTWRFSDSAWLCRCKKTTIAAHRVLVYLHLVCLPNLGCHWSCPCPYRPWPSPFVYSDVSQPSCPIPLRKRPQPAPGLPLTMDGPYGAAYGLVKDQRWETRLSPRRHGVSPVHSPIDVHLFACFSDSPPTNEICPTHQLTTSRQTQRHA